MSLKNKMLVSIVMTTYNGEKYLAEQLESISNQTYENLEIIIVDDCSSDTTFEILEMFRFKDKRIKLFKNKINLGFKKNFEHALLKAQGTYIALSDQDDIWRLDKIEKLVNSIGKYDLIHSSLSLIDENSELIKEEWNKHDTHIYTFEEFVFGNRVTGCTILMKQVVLDVFFPIPSAEQYHDWWLALIASKLNGIVFLDEKLVLYRQHNTQDTGAKIESLSEKIKRLSHNVINKKKSNRYKKAHQQIERLESYKEERGKFFNTIEKHIINDAISYYKNYSESFFHLKSFFIGIKYSKEIHYKNPFYIKSLLLDLVG